MDGVADEHARLGWVWAFSTDTETEFHFQADVVIFMRNTAMPHTWVTGNPAATIADNPFRQ